MPNLYHFFFFFNDTATTEIYTLSLHDALPISQAGGDVGLAHEVQQLGVVGAVAVHEVGDRKSTRLNSSHLVISYAVFCLKKKKTSTRLPPLTSPVPRTALTRGRTLLISYSDKT